MARTFEIEGGASGPSSGSRTRVAGSDESARTAATNRYPRFGTVSTGPDFFQQPILLDQVASVFDEHPKEVERASRHRTGRDSSRKSVPSSSRPTIGSGRSGLWATAR
jgi:hypothetical protein